MHQFIDPVVKKVKAIVGEDGSHDEVMLSLTEEDLKCLFLSKEDLQYLLKLIEETN